MFNKCTPYAILFVLFFSLSCKKEAIEPPTSNNLDTVKTNKLDTSYTYHSISITDSPKKVTVFQQMKNGYQVYRIPALFTTDQGTLLAFCEARKMAQNGDSGDIDVVFKRSYDNGVTWSDQQIVFDDGVNTCDNPVLVQDKKTHTIWLFMSHNPGNTSEVQIIHNSDFTSRTVWVSKSDNDGITWSKPTDITSSVKDPAWAWYATGPGTGIQIANGPQKGRLIIPCDDSYVLNKGFVYGSHVIYSDDNGKTWNLGGSSGPGSNECEVAEIDDGKGTLLMNSRYFGKSFSRVQAISHDGGLTWTAPQVVPLLTDPNCEGSLISYLGNCLLLSNDDSTARVNLTLKSSFDKGLTWNKEITIDNGFTAYSSLSVLNNEFIACLYETGLKSPYETISFKAFKATLK